MKFKGFIKNRKAIAVVGILLVLGTLVASKLIQKERIEDVHFHAGFVVFDNGKKVDFSDFKYMDISPCEEQDGKHLKVQTSEQVQKEKAHLHDGVGDVVHVHIKGARWSDLFLNINYPIEYGPQTVGYINGKLTPNFQDQEIGPEDSLVVFLEKTDESLLKQAVTKSHIEEIESKSELCGVN